MKLLLRLSILLFIAAACASPNKKKDSKAEDKKAKVEEQRNIRLTECKNNSDVRTIEIKEGEAESFDVVYTKFGNSKSIASGSRAHCEKIRDRVKNNLFRNL